MKISKSFYPLILGGALLLANPPLVNAADAPAKDAGHAAAPSAAASATGDKTRPAAAPAAPAAAPAAAPEPSKAAPAPAAAAPGPDADASSDNPRLKEATEAYNSGVAALKGGNLDSAGTFFEKTAALTPEDGMASMLLGYVRLKQGRYDDALVALQTAQKNAARLDVHSQAIIYNNIGMAYWNQKEYSKALPAYQQAVALDKSYVDARYNLAFALLSQNRGKEALPHFVDLLAKNPRDAMLQDGLGQTYENLGDWPHAFAAYTRAMELNPRDSSYPLNLALAYIRADPSGANGAKRDAAIGYLRKATMLNPQGAPAFLQLGLLLIEKKRWSEAQDALRRYTVLKPDDFVGQFNLALSYDYAGNKFDEALKTYNEAAQLQPADPAVKNNVGRIYLKRNLFTDAIVQFRKALTIDPDFADARNNLALALAAVKDYKNSNDEWTTLIEQTNRAINHAAKDPKATHSQRLELIRRVISARAALAENYLKIDLYADAAAQYKQLLRLSPKNIAAMSNLGLTLYHTHEYKQALDYYDQVIKLDPKNAIAHNNRGVVLEALNNRSAALAAYKTAVQLRPDYTEAKANRDRLLAGTVVG